MTKNLYLNLFLSLLVLLLGFKFSYGLTDYWTIRIIKILSIIIAALFLIKFNPSSLPKKENQNFKLQYIFPITVGIIGLFVFNHFVLLLGYKLMDWEWIGEVNRTKSESILLVVFIIVWALLEELYCRRIIAQKIYNSKGFSKALWISALIFGLAHTFSDSGFLTTFIGGLIIGYVYLRTLNIWLSIFTHITYNVIYFFVSPIIEIKIGLFNSYQAITMFLGFGILLLWSMFLIFKKQTELKTSR
ncbi:CPBP family intramembrane glutamic endopeptidase [Tamlana sp. I1]|uniref:CPBP family intramembrane glutamic endopeptidase n=1 Tax=Tamlana sp. I1 TaxID=2762061 RepID=UPI00188F988A|nr:CPBP family intramembrane glutamic endopeptidase [Tamlana sp. I1]